LAIGKCRAGTWGEAAFRVTLKGALYASAGPSYGHFIVNEQAGGVIFGSWDPDFEASVKHIRINN
jgi:hypothetical protein